MSAAIAAMSPNFSLPWSQVPVPDLSAPRPGCHPSSITTNGRFSPVGDNSTTWAASVRTVSAVFFPYAQYQSLLPYNGKRGGRAARGRLGVGGGHMRRQNACSAANDDSPSWPARHTTSHTSSVRSSSRTPTPPLLTSAQRLMPCRSICQKQNELAPALTPYACVSDPSNAAQYHGITRSGVQPRHSRSPYPRSHASPTTSRVALKSPRQRRWIRFTATVGDVSP